MKEACVFVCLCQHSEKGDRRLTQRSQNVFLSLSKQEACFVTLKINADAFLK